VVGLLWKWFLLLVDEATELFDELPPLPLPTPEVVTTSPPLFPPTHSPTMIVGGDGVLLLLLLFMGLFLLFIESYSERFFLAKLRTSKSL
jgi:hypothetical protein